ncbi:sensor histidine kinase [Streptomyces sp. 4N509B]|uniref:sensor histidine kinase n=1 Tax=Streptomyces sp. 4N509B TaxID=3457413 RepID=UPI003FD2C072
MQLPRRPARPHRDDVVIALAGLLGGLVGIVFELHVLRPDVAPSPWMLGGLLLMCGAELLRRSAQPWVLAPGLLALVLDGLTGGLLAVVIMFTDLVYAAVLYGRPRAARAVLRGSVLLTVAGTVAAVAWLRQPEALLFGVLLAGGLAAPAWTALIIRDHRDEAAAERLRAEQTALLAEMDRVQAVTAERSRMARELHDLVANHLSAIAIHATAALSLDDLDQHGRAHTALTVIRENSTQGLAEMRQLIGLLRRTATPDGGSGETGERAGPEAVPSLDGVDALVERAARGGTSAQLRFTHHDARAGRPRPPAPVELAAYRIVQESLTNAVKHAAPGEVSVVVTQDARTLTVDVTSPYDGARPASARAPGSGAGLTGMRERVALLGGSFVAGRVAGHAPPPEDGDGCRGNGATVWRVRAELPLGDAAAAAHRQAGEAT